MAQNYDVHYFSQNIGLTAGTTSTPLFVNGSANGCIKVLSAGIWSGGAGTVTAYLVWSDATGGTVAGTVCTLGSAACVFAAAGTAAVVHDSTISTSVVPPGYAVCVKLVAGTAGSDTCVSVAYLKGQ